MSSPTPLQERLCAWLPALALWATTAGCSAPAVCTPDGPAPNVVLITIDTLRQDHVSIYGADHAATPNLDRLAQAGVVFDHAYTDVSWTTPSVTSTMTGIYATKHGVRNFHDRLGPEALTIAEVLAAGGYRTGATVGSYPVDSVYGLDQGFEFYDDEFTRSISLAKTDTVEKIDAEWFDSPEEQSQFNLRKMGANSRRTDEEVTDAAIAVLDRIGGGKETFFLWLHYFGPHSIPDKTKRYIEDLAHHKATYPAKVENTDTQVGRFLDELDARGLTDNTLVVVHADHGESLGEHNFVGHGRFLYDDNLRIPTLARWPGRIEAGTRTDAMVANVDLFPTIAEACGCSAVLTPPSRWTRYAERIFGKGARAAARPPIPLDGRSWFPVLAGEAAPREPMYAETWMPSAGPFYEIIKARDGSSLAVPVARFAMVLPRHKLVLTRPASLFGSSTLPLASEFVRNQYVSDEVFDRAEDPGEVSPLTPQTGDAVHDRLTSMLDPHVLASLRLLQDSSFGSDNPPDDTDLEKLRALGYVE